MKNRWFQIPVQARKGKVIRSLSFRLHRVFQRLHKYPNDIVIETASVCNLNCTICRSVKADLGRKNRFMSFDLFKRLLMILPLYAILSVFPIVENLCSTKIFLR